MSATGILGFIFLFRIAYFRMGKWSHVQGVCYDYNHILVLTASFGFFYLFYHLKLGGRGFVSKAIRRIAPYTLEAYLWHEHLAVRYNCPEWFYNVLRVLESTVLWILYLLFLVAVIFSVGIFMDMFRKIIFRGVGKWLLCVRVLQRFNLWLDGFTIGEKTDIRTAGK